ncbi:ABC transporter ATP-binding protein [Geminicoccaceae bacterium 1502E]|nr:ABC transporter ATP-binding protein [Geminicoccaceae bacterium 1502E]
MSDAAFLDLAGMTLGYDGKAAVESLDLAIKEGELVALLGPSGCGKTTTMRAIAGLLQPMGGRITLGGRDITSLPANRRNIGLVFQSYALFPHLSVFENVAFGLRRQRTPKDELERRVAGAVAMVGLTGFERRLPKELSGGQQQRVALARAVVVRPRLLLLDEPLSNLDARLRLEMRTELRRLQRELGITMVYVTHDQEEALALADRIVVMRDGKIEQMGPPEAIYETPATDFVARFVGFENVFEVRDGQLRAGNGAALPLQAPVDGDTAWLAWRPHAVELGQGPYEGRVRGTSYLGQSVEYLIESALGPIKAEAPAALPRHEAGRTVAFGLPPAAAAAITR